MDTEPMKTPTEWATEWLNAVGDGSNTMSRCKLTSIEKRDGSVGQIMFAASGPNFPNVITELLLQLPAHGARAPKANLYRPRAFAAFALAYRFVNA